MKNSYYRYFLWVIVLLFTGCIFFGEEKGIIRVNNNTSGELQVSYSIDGGSSRTYVPTEHSSTDYEVDTDSGSVSVELTITGTFKLVENFSFNLSSDDMEVIDVEPNAGAIAFTNYGFDDLLWVWLVPDDPTSYTSRAQVESEASYVIENIGPGGYTTLTCCSGTYYVIIQNYDMNYYYQTDTVVVEIDKHGNVDCDLTNTHPSL